MANQDRAAAFPPPSPQSIVSLPSSHSLHLPYVFDTSASAFLYYVKRRYQQMRKTTLPCTYCCCTQHVLPKDTLYYLSLTTWYISCNFQSGFFCQSSWNFRKSNITHSIIQFDVDFAKSSVFEIRHIWFICSGSYPAWCIRVLKSIHECVSIRLVFNRCGLSIPHCLVVTQSLLFTICL